ncbi:MAG: helix-turn-helix domain-containing protein [Frankiales bacterium]|nr:helix-turn-helix domain-containing protein [Frankiales bacterium]
MTTPALDRPVVLSPGRALRELISGTPDTDADALGIPVGDARVVVVQTETPHLLERLQRAIPLPRRCATTSTADEWVLLLSGVPHRSGVDAAEREAARVLTELRRCQVGGWHGGISAPVRGADDLPSAYRDAADCAGLAARDGQPFLAADEVWARLACARLRTVTRSALPTRSPIDALRQHDERNGTPYGETLGAWLGLGCDTNATANVLCVHPNTLRYRLHRAASLIGLDLDDSNQRLVLQLAFGD